MIRASRIAGKRIERREKERERYGGEGGREPACIRCIKKTETMTAATRQNDENHHVQCERLNEFRYTVKADGAFVYTER